ncbi:MAG: photosystem I reaction center subunit XI [Nostocaceae cyanobacterium]|nr:photosystem I reaction center subunit XI [Nostocaceae cyanobacterium]
MAAATVDPRDTEVVFPAGGDPQLGNLETPVNASAFSKWYISNLPAYRPGLTTFRRGLEIGMAHGYFIYGPFALLGPLRNAPNASLAGLLEAIGLVVILTAALSLYANSNPKKPYANVTVANQPQDFNNKEGWNNFASAFLIGGIGGACTAYFLATNLGFIKGLFG